MECINDWIMNDSGNKTESDTKQHNGHNGDKEICVKEETDNVRSSSTELSKREYKLDRRLAIPTRNGEDGHSGKCSTQSTHSVDVSYGYEDSRRDSNAAPLDSDKEYITNEDTSWQEDSDSIEQESEEDLTDIIQNILEETECNGEINEENTLPELSNDCSEGYREEITTSANGCAPKIEKTLVNEEDSVGLSLNTIDNIPGAIDDAMLLKIDHHADEPSQDRHTLSGKRVKEFENENHSALTNKTNIEKPSIATDNDILVDRQVDTDSRFSSCEVTEGTLVECIEIEREKIGWTGDSSNGFTCNSKVFSRKPRCRKNKDQSKSPDPNSIEALAPIYKVSTNLVSRMLAFGIIQFVEEKQEDTFPWRSRILDKKIKQAKRKQEFFKSVQWVDLYECSDAVLEIFNEEERAQQEDKNNSDECSFVCVIV